jgi:hypothetical protein
MLALLLREDAGLVREDLFRGHFYLLVESQQLARQP